MLRLTLKNLAANRLRFALTTFAVILAVSFVVSSFVLTDGLRSSFNTLSGEIVGGTDFEVRPVDDLGRSEPLSPALLDQVADVEGVAVAAPVVEADNTIRPINADGQEISTAGPPQLAFAWIDDARLSSFTMVEGEPPRQPGEFTMDLDAAANHGFSVGQTYDLITPGGRTQATLTGLVSFGADNDTLGATLMQFDLPVLQELVGIDGYDSIQVAVDDGADRNAVESELVVLATGAEIVDNATLESEQRADFNSGIDVIGNILLGFAGISLFVSIFIIYNTFSIVLGQRTRELGLLRTVGADPVQLRRSVLAEAAVIGSAASAIGIGAGVGVAFGLRALFDAIGAQLPDSPVIISGRTIIVAAVVGIGATMVSAIGPARRASRVSPIAALRDGAAAGAASGRTRLLVGVGLLAAGAVAGGLGLFVASTTASVVALLAVGAIGMFTGLAMASPVVAVPLTTMLGWPGRRLFGVSGRLAQDNAGRNPQRTATTAAALMIGLAMVAMALVVGESVKAELRSTLESSVQADYLIDENGDSYFTPAVAADLDDLAETGPVASFRYDEARVGGELTGITGTNLVAAEHLFDFGISSGLAVEPTISDPVLISDEVAASESIRVGDIVSMTFGGGVERDLTVIGVYEDDVIVEEGHLLDLATWVEVGAEPADAWIGFSLADGVTPSQAAA
ncbi:MAG: ABC transporter permease, partial [Actinomycetia bacterium]|nr:ABC transporter permease [Actinomycetes bacterium]